MNKEQKIQVVVEAAGECWHEWNNMIKGHNTAAHQRIYKCVKCGKGGTDHVHLSWCHPKPTDLNELFRLAEKLGVEFTLCLSIYTQGDNMWSVEPLCADVTFNEITPAEALLNALYETVKEKDKRK